MLHFESTVCGRCGGSGQYSFNLTHGTMCYGCSETGVKLSKRGKAAQEYFINSMLVPVEEIKEGDFIRFWSSDNFLEKSFLRMKDLVERLVKNIVLGIP